MLWCICSYINVMYNKYIHWSKVLYILLKKEHFLNCNLYTVCLQSHCPPQRLHFFPVGITRFSRSRKSRQRVLESRYFLHRRMCQGSCSVVVPYLCLLFPKSTYLTHSQVINVQCNHSFLCVKDSVFYCTSLCSDFLVLAGREAHCSDCSCIT